jgi:hypothetical protein
MHVPSVPLYYGSTNVDKAEGGERIKPACIEASDKTCHKWDVGKGCLAVEVFVDHFF